MSKCFIEGMGGGTKLFAAIGVTYPEGSTLTCTDGKKTLKAKTTSGQWVFAIPEAGTWTITSTDPTGANKPASKTVEITSEGQVVSVELSYGFYLYKNGNEYTERTGGWTADGYKWDVSGYTTYAGEKNADNLYCQAKASGSATLLGTANAIDLTNFSTLILAGECNVAGVRICKTKSITDSNIAAQSEAVGGMDISSLTGSYYVVLSAQNNASRYVRATSILLE